MKKYLLLLMLFAFSFSYSQDWKLIFELKNGTYYYKANTKNTAWIKLVSDKTEYFPDEISKKAIIVDGYKLMLWKFDCRSRQTGIIQIIAYSQDGEVLDTYRENEILVEMDYVIPGTIGEGLLETFCNLK